MPVLPLDMQLIGSIEDRKSNVTETSFLNVSKIPGCRTGSSDPPFRITHVSLSNFWVPIQSLCTGGDYATLVPP